MEDLIRGEDWRRWFIERGPTYFPNTWHDQTQPRAIIYEAGSLLKSSEDSETEQCEGVSSKREKEKRTMEMK